MKYKIIGGIGIVAAIQLFLVYCGLVLHNAGCEVVSHGSQYYERFHFNWSAIVIVINCCEKTDNNL